MDKDREAFRNRFLAYKNGKSIKDIYDAGLPKYATGTEGFDDTVDFLKQYEGFKNTAYKDANGVPTIGYGFTNPTLVKRGTMSRSEADVRLRQELVNRDRFLSRLNNWDKLGDSAKTALRSYYYNYPAGFKEATKFMKAWNAGNYAEAIRQVDAGWNDAKNPGLRTRRQAELKRLREDPFLMSTMKAPEVKLAPIVNVPVSTAVRQTIPAEQTIARWTGAEDVSPYLTGKPLPRLLPIVKLPTILELVEELISRPGFKCGKLPGYKIGHNVSNAKLNDDGTFTDDYTRTFEDMVVTPKRTELKRGSYSANNWNYAKTHRKDWMKTFLSEGVVDDKPLKLTYPEFELLLGGRQLANELLPIKVKPSFGKPRIQQTTESWLSPIVLKKQERFVPDIKDLISEKDLNAQLGEYLGEGGELVVYRSKVNPDYAIKIKSNIYENPTLDHLEFTVNRDLSMNKLPGVEPVRYKGFTYETNPIRTKNPVTGEVKLNLNELFIPIYEQKIVTPSHKVNTDAFNIDLEFVVNDWLADHGYIYNPNTTYYGANGVLISDYGFNNFGFDSFGNMKLIDPMIQGFKDGKSPIHIKPANRGKFTVLKKRTGHSASWFKQNGTPAQKKMATFALNARKWKH